MTTVENWKRIDIIYDEAIKLDKAKQKEYVCSTCQNDEEIIKQVMKMLEANNSQDFMSQYPGIIIPENIDLSIPENLGHFKIIKKIATGGMGRVYLGQSTTSDVQIKVALKTIRIELISKELRDKFQNEKNILSQLKHKNIASLIDAGISNNQIPYIATEWVDGENIKDYCINNNLPIKQRLRLFLQICDAMIFAHNKMIIHRDLKPDNILVNTQKQVKLLDFGIAKIVDENQSQQTQTQIFTPDYAAPEQLNGEMCTAATDIYSLGIILFEMLTNSKRFNLSNSSIAEKIKTIEVPTQFNLSEIKPQNPLPYSGSKLNGPLSNIINKAMHVDPNRRYNSVTSFVADIENFGEKRPIKAMKDSYWYIFKMLILRNKTSSLFIFLALFTASVAAIITIKQLNEKLLEVQKSQQVTDFLIDSIQASDPDLTKGKQISLVEYLQNVKRQVEERAFVDDILSSTLKFTVGIALTKVGKYRDAEDLLVDAIAINKNNIKARIGLANLYIEQKSYKLAEEQFYVLKTEVQKLSKEESAQLNILFAKILSKKGQFNKAISLLKGTIDVYKQFVSINLLIDVQLELATILDESSRVKESIKILRQTLSLSEQEYGVISIRTTNILNEMARVLSNSSPVPWTEVFELYDKSLNNQNILYGEYHPIIAKTLLNQGFAYKLLRKLDKAYKDGEKAREIAIRNFGKHHILTAHSDLLLSQIEYLKGHLSPAIKQLQSAIQIYSDYYGESHFSTNELKTTLAGYLLKSRNANGALNILLPLYESQKQQLGENSLATFYVKLNIIKAYTLQNRNQKAVEVGVVALDKAKEHLGSENTITIGIQIALAKSYLATGERSKAIKLSNELLTFNFIKNTSIYKEAIVSIINEAKK